MPYRTYISLVGSGQPQPMSRSTDLNRIGWMEIVAVATGNRGLSDIKITKDFDASSARLAKAYHSKEIIPRLIVEMVDSSGQGNQRVVARSVFTKATIVDMRPHIGRTASSGILSDFTIVYESEAGGTGSQESSIPSISEITVTKRSDSASPGLWEDVPPARKS